MRSNDSVNLLKNLIYNPLEVQLDYNNVDSNYKAFCKGNKPDIFINGFHGNDLKVAFELILEDLNEKDKRIEELESTIGFLKRVINNVQ